MLFNAEVWKQYAYTRVLLSISSMLLTCWIILLPLLARETDREEMEENLANIDNDPMTTPGFGIKYLMDKEKIYKQPGIKVEDVAKMLGSNRTYLSQAVKIIYGCSFPELLNARRIEDAKSLIREEPHIRIYDLAIRYGFSNASVFGKAFKDATGKSAMEWKKQA